ncbi:MAG: AAA family ATPase [Thermodesulfobacteriota bacterium]|nr:AAA family ATPase [Thermodesulfobacteriota bacterium]
MIVTCKNCESSFKLDEGVIKKQSVKVRCSKCNYVFSVFRPGTIQEPEQEADCTKHAVETAAVQQEVQFASSGTNQLFGVGEGKSEKQTPVKTIVITNQKGGVAKTSTCLNLGVSLALLNKRVLLVDFDAQSNLTVCLGYQSTESFYEILNSENKDLAEILIKTPYPNLSLLPSGKNMVLLNKKYFNAANYEYILKHELNAIKDQFDYILIDTPPSIEFFTINALTAADLAIIPCQCEYLATYGVNRIIKIIQLIKEKTNPDIDYKILFTMYEDSAVVSELIRTKLKQKYDGRTFNTIIEYDTKIKESQILRKPAIYHNKKSRAGIQYYSLAKGMLGR